MLNPFTRTQFIVVAGMVGRITEAHKAPDAAAKTEALLAAREETERHMKALEIRHGDMGFATMLTAFGGMGLMIAGFGALLASPLFVGGAAVFAASLASMYGLGKAVDALRADRDALDAKIMQDVKMITDAAPEEARQSPRYSKSLASFFNIKADPKTEADYAKITARYMRKAPQTPAPAAYYHDIH